MHRRGKAGVVLVAIVAAVLAVASFAGAAAAAEPVTASNDALRTGWYPDEPKLSPAAISGDNFGQIFETPIQGQVYAQPLVSNGTLLVVTEDNWIYGLDPATGAVKWSRNVGTPFVASEIPGCTDLVPNVGITGTPVIDPDTGIAYFFAKTYSVLPKAPIWQLHAVDMASGAEAPGFPVTVSGNAENITHPEFKAKQELQRPGLLMMNGVVYAGFGSHCDNLPYQGWLVGVSTAGQVKTMWATGPEGSAIWQSGGGLVSDGSGQILFATGNSFGPTPPDSPTPPSDLGEAVARVEIGSTGAATTTDFFSPFNREELDEKDLDLGSSAPTALPSQYFGTPTVPNLMLVGGKEHKIFVLDREHLGGQGQGQGAGGGNDVVEQIPNGHGVFGSMAVWPGQGGYVYVPGIGSTGGVEVLQYGTEAGRPKFSLIGKTPEPLAFGSGSPIVTSDGTTPGSAVVWVPRCPKSGTCSGSVLDAYPADPAEGTAPLFEAPIGIAPKFGRAGVADGRIYVGTRDGRLLGFGVLRESTPEGGGSGGGGSSQSGSGSPGGPAAAATTGSRPQTKITHMTLNRSKDRAAFRFASEPGGATFECRLLRLLKPVSRAVTPDFRRCASPRIYRFQPSGRYRFEVRAVNAVGPDTTPAKRRFAF